MERRYLVAALAIIVTFAGLSQGFRSLQRISLLHAEHLGAVAKAKCEASPAARAVAKMRTHLRPGYAEEAQLLAEMNVPIAAVEAGAAQRIAQQDLAAAQCARANAVREAERARRAALKLRDRARADAQAMPAPISLQVNLPNEVNQQIANNMAVLTRRLATQQVQLQIAASRLQAASVRIANPHVSVAYSDDTAGRHSSSATVHIQCNNNNEDSSWQRDAERSARDAAREAARQMEYSYNSK